jgi:hypothetical protein
VVKEAQYQAVGAGMDNNVEMNHIHQDEQRSIALWHYALVVLESHPCVHLVLAAVVGA